MPISYQQFNNSMESYFSKYLAMNNIIGSVKLGQHFYRLFLIIYYNIKAKSIIKTIHFILMVCI
jgi:hypothetical protein